MLHQTKYGLEIIKGNDGFTDYEKEISDISGYENPFDYDCAWFNHEAQMKEYSKRHPNTLFKLIAYGLYPNDISHKYFLNGKMQVDIACIVFDGFDESKLV